MAEITAAQVKELRDATGISMMKCKNALVEANGDLEAARDILRKSGEKDAAKKADRETGEGGVFVTIADGKAAIVALACETDFVARGDDFQNAGKELTALTLEKGADTAKAEAEPIVQATVQKCGENIQLTDAATLEGETLGSYIHSNGKIGVAVAMTGGSEELAKDVAMQVAAMNPTVVTPDEVSEADVAKETEIQREMLAAEGKPAEMAEKILEGKIRKFREEKALVKQVFVKDGSQTVEKVLEAAGAKVEKFVRFGA